MRWTLGLQTQTMHIFLGLMLSAEEYSGGPKAVISHSQDFVEILGWFSFCSLQESLAWPWMGTCTATKYQMYPIRNPAWMSSNGETPQNPATILVSSRPTGIAISAST